MTQNFIVGEAPIHRGGKGCDVVDPLANERAFMKQVLINVRDRVCVGVNAGFSPIQPDKPRWAAFFQFQDDAWLQNPVSIGDNISPRIDVSPIEQMGQNADHLPRRIARQQGVSVQRNDEFCVVEDRDLTDDGRERFGRSMNQQGIEICQFPTFPLVSHPDLILGIPIPRPMQQEEDIRRVVV